MKAAIYPGHGKPITIEDLPDPEPGPDDIVIKVHRCGICGTDLSMTKGEMWDYGPNSQLGHEYAGEIVAMGRNVSGFGMGEKIAVLPSGACGHCEGCKGGNHILCRNAPGAMVGFAEFAKLPPNTAVKLPNTLSMADGALVEPLAVSLDGVRQSRIEPGDNVLVLGGGTVALYAIYWARRLGARRIVAMSRSDRRKDLCLRMGADAFIHYGDNEVGEVIEALGGSPDIVYECVGSEGMLTKSIMHAKLYGKVVSLGFCTHMDPVMPAMGSFKCVTIQFLGGTMREFLYIADQADKGHCDPKAIITNDIPLIDMPTMMDVLRGPNNETKVHVHCGGFEPEIQMAAIPALVVGTGFGCRIHVPALRAAGFEVVGLVGTNPERLARKAAESEVPASFTDLDEAIARTGAKVVTVATTPATHAGVALKAIAHGCHVLCEKPFAFDAAEGRTLLDAAEKAGVVHMVAHEFRWQPDRALFGRAISEGLIGEPRFLVLDQFIPFCADPETRLPKWWFDKDAAGGWLGAGGSHIMDQVRAWLGEFASLSANLMVVSDRKDVAEDSYSMRFLMKNGVEGSMQQTAGAWGPMAMLWRCAGTKGTVWSESGKVFVADRQGTRELTVPEDLILPPPPPAADPNSSRSLSHLELAPFTRLCEALRDAVEGRKPQSAVPVPTFTDGLASMRLMDAIRASAANGGALQQL